MYPPSAPPHGSAIPGGYLPVPTILLLEGTVPQLAPPAPPSPTTCAKFHPESPSQCAVENPDSALTDFMEVYTQLDNSQGVPTKVPLKRLATLPLSNHPPPIIFVERPYLHICVMWGQMFLSHLFPTPLQKTGRYLHFFRTSVTDRYLSQWKSHLSG